MDAVEEWTWDFGDGQFSTDSEPLHRYETAGAYTVKLTVSNPGGVDSAEKINYINVLDHSSFRVTSPNAQEKNIWHAGSPLIVEWQYEQHPCDFVRITLLRGTKQVSVMANNDAEIDSDTGDDLKKGRYEWTIPPTMPPGSDYRVRVGSPDNSLDWDQSTSFTITVPTPVANFKATPTSGKTPLTVDFTNTSTGEITAHSWSFGDGGTSTEKSPAHEYLVNDQDQVFTVLLDVTGPGGTDRRTRKDLITVYAPIVANFTLNPDSGIVPLTVQFKDNSTNTVTSWAWSFGDGTTSNAQNPKHTYKVPGLYDVRLTATGPWGSANIEKVACVTVQEKPTIELTSPTSTDSWTAGTSHAITWAYTGNPGPYVKLDLIKSGSVVSTIKSSTPIGSNSSGSFTWDVPQRRASGIDYRVRITSTDNSSYTDISETFTILEAQKYTVSGTVRLNGAPLAGVKMTLTGADSTTATTLADGTYRFEGLYNGNYTITPISAPHEFTPERIQLTVDGQNVTGQDFTATVVPTYTISGTVRSGGVGVSGITMTLSGKASATIQTNAQGEYSFAGLAKGRYTITPSKTSYTFSPSSQIVDVTEAGNVTGVDFTATSTVTYAISGRVTASGSGLGGVSVVLSGAASVQKTTSADGYFNFTELGNGSYTITPSLTGYTFSPAGRNVTLNGANVTGQDFTATYVTYTLTVLKAGAKKGRVTSSPAGIDCDSNCPSASSIFQMNTVVTLTATPSNSQAVFAGWSGGGCSGTGPCVVTMTGNTMVTATFEAASTYTISGTVTQANGTPVSGGVTVSLSGSDTSSTTTQEDGSYSFTGLYNGGYTITPTRSGYTFNPVSRNVTISGANVTAQNFTAIPGNVFSVSGKVTLAGGQAIAGVSIGLVGPHAATTTTNASGDYTFSNLGAGTYTVTPSLAGYSFDPASATVTITTGDVANVSFTATSFATYSISGQVTKSTGGALAGVTISLSGPTSTTTTTNAQGAYSFSDLPAGGYTLTPSLSHYSFSPSSLSVSLTTGNQTGKNFTATLNQYTLDVTVIGSSRGDVTVEGINCGSSCSNQYDALTSVTLRATAKNGKTFTGWGGACSNFGTSVECILNMNGNKTVTATFTN